MKHLNSDDLTAVLVLVMLALFLTFIVTLAWPENDAPEVSPVAIIGGVVSYHPQVER